MKARPTPTPLVSIIVVNHNSGPRLARCLEAIGQAARGLAHEVLVVDNASTDDSAAFLRRKTSPGTRLLEPGRNLLFTGGVNFAAAQAGGRYVLLLNPDMVARPGSISALVSTLEQDPRVGAAAGLVLRRDGEVERRYLRRLPTPWAWYVQSFRSQRRATRSKAYRHYAMLDVAVEAATVGKGPAKAPIEVPQPGGGCLLIRMEFLREGLADDALYGIYFSDVDLARRMADAGAKTLLVPGAQFLHDHADIRTTAARSWRVSADYYAGAVRYFRRWHGRRGAAWARTLILWGLLFRLAHKTAAVALRREPAAALADHARVTGSFLVGRNPLLEASP